MVSCCSFYFTKVHTFYVTDLPEDTQDYFFTFEFYFIRYTFTVMIAIINGPNLNLLGKRQPEIYGSVSFGDFLRELRKRHPDTEIEYFQSNSEGEIIDHIHRLGYDTPQCEGIIINPGAYAHYSYAIADAISSITLPVVEVHISNIHAREEFRHKSVTAPSCKAMLCGFGMEGYALALEWLLRK